MSRKIIEEKFKASVANNSPTDWFHEVYRLAAEGTMEVPWDDKSANPWLVSWLKRNPLKPKTKTLDVACGLGDNAEFLASLGLDVSAADLSPQAITMAKERFPESSIEYEVADFFTPPSHFLGAFDFVSEVYTLQAVPDSHRLQLLQGIASCVAPNGLLLIVARHRPCGSPKKTTPPFALEKEFIDEVLKLGFKRESWEEVVDAYEDTPIYRLIASYRRN